ncbi:hypothetical protein EXN66_Car003726 [Channa argus]|uniref:Uncharacterized protein n=1 Tax=Channa argus TaxID=215402 RepID=A0A6G1PD55_CHAAH|nr:hypothetical protein EXN66_Car003726 [Channa argus]
MIERGPGLSASVFYLLKQRSTGSFVSRSDYCGQLLEEGGHRPDPRLPRALRGSGRLPTAPRGSRSELLSNLHTPLLVETC